jgi:hypothetical protein
MALKPEKPGAEGRQRSAERQRGSEDRDQDRDEDWGNVEHPTGRGGRMRDET